MCMYVCMYVRMYVSRYVYVCMYVCECVRMCMGVCSPLLSNEVHRSHKCMDLISGMPTSRGRHKTTYYKIVRSTRL